MGNACMSGDSPNTDLDLKVVIGGDKKVTSNRKVTEPRLTGRSS